MEKHQLLNGNLEESAELLNLFARECKEDTKDIKLSLRETGLEIDERVHTIKR